jgi:hypothetical protein
MHIQVLIVLYTTAFMILSQAGVLMDVFETGLSWEPQKIR